MRCLLQCTSCWEELRQGWHAVNPVEENYQQALGTLHWSSIDKNGRLIQLVGS